MTGYEKALAVIEAEHKIVDVVYKYIDRMNDLEEFDSRDDIIDLFIADVNPTISEHLNTLGWIAK